MHPGDGSIYRAVLNSMVLACGSVDGPEKKRKKERKKERTYKTRPIFVNTDLPLTQYHKYLFRKFREQNEIETVFVRSHCVRKMNMLSVILTKH